MTSRARVAGSLLLDGRYRLESRLAVGGMGTIWRAVHTTLDRVVAVKFIDVGSQDDAVVDRCLHEAMVVAGIHHPNVVDILDFGCLADGEAFMVMEFLEGESLEVRRARGPALTTIQVVQIAGQLLSGLEAVHRSGIVHCDVKPGNIVLTESEDGELFARLLDFGASSSLDAKSELDCGQHEDPASDHVVVGTPEYMSPEHARGSADLDARTDVYSVAVVLYEALSGALPYPGDDPCSIVRHLLQGECTPLGLLRPDIPEIADVIDGAMQLDRDRRPASAHEFRHLLFAAAGLTGDPTGLSQLPGRTSVVEPSPHVVAPSSPALADAPRSSAVMPLPGRFGVTGSAAHARVGLLALASALTLALTGAGWALFTGASAAPASAPDRAIVELEPIATPIASLAPIRPAAAAGDGLEPAPSREVGALGSATGDGLEPAPSGEVGALGSATGDGLEPAPSAETGAPLGSATAEPVALEARPRRASSARAPSGPRRVSGDVVRRLDF